MLGEYWETHPMQGMSGDPSGIGQVYRDGSLGHAYRDGSLGATVRPAPNKGSGLARQSLFGLAGDADIMGVGLGLLALGLVVRGTAGYFAGRAMDRKYRWWGAGTAAVFGAAGLGVLGFVAKK